MYLRHLSLRALFLLILFLYLKLFINSNYTYNAEFYSNELF